MKPEDKFGNPIYSGTYNKMLKYAFILRRHGYSEAANKPNLFYRKDDRRGIVFFSDMRGTEEIPIWEDASPLLYAKFPHDMPKWKRRRLFQEEYGSLGVCRVSFYSESEPEGLLFGEGGDGYCLVCGKDFGDEGIYCSKQCEEANAELDKERCRVCGKVLEYNQPILHHLSYREDKTITVCRSCHSKIHRGATFPKLKPSE